MNQGGKAGDSLCSFALIHRALEECKETAEMCCLAFWSSAKRLQRLLGIAKHVDIVRMFKSSGDEQVKHYPTALYGKR